MKFFVGVLALIGIGVALAVAREIQYPVLGAFVKALPNTVLYPSDANWTATVLPAVKQTIGTAVTGDPTQVLDQLQQKAMSGG